MKDFFISYNKFDREMAKWIAGTLEENGYSTYIQAWDFRPGDNFILKMQDAIESCERCIAVLSQDYLNSEYCQPEWAAIFNKDPASIQRMLIPVRVSDVYPKGLLSGIIYIDLFNVEDKSIAAKKLLQGVDRKENPRKKGAYLSEIQYRNKQNNDMLMDDLCRIKIDCKEDIFQYLNKNVTVLTSQERWIQIQLLFNELIYNINKYSNADSCCIELANNSISIIDNGTKFNPLVQLMYDSENPTKRMGSLVLKTFLEQFRELLEVSYEYTNEENRFTVLLKNDVLFNIEGVCTITVALNGIQCCCEDDVILPIGICKNYYFDIWSDDRKYGVSMSFLVTAIQSMINVIPKTSKLIIYDRSFQLNRYQRVFKMFPQVVFRT